MNSEPAATTWTDFRGRVAFVSGAGGGGIGSTTAAALAQLGAHVIVNARVEGDAVAVVERIRAAGGSAEPAIVDVSHSAAVEDCLARVHARVGQLDVLVANAAGDRPATALAEMTDELWRSELEENLAVGFFCARAAARWMSARHYGRIVFVSSSAALRGTWGRSAGYAAAKAGLIGLARRLALELAEHGITVNAVAPSQVDTPRVRRGGRRTDASLATYARSVPLGRVGRPEDVAHAIAFLASERAGYITGQVLEIDGGMSLASRVTATA